MKFFSLGLAALISVSLIGSAGAEQTITKRIGEGISGIFKQKDRYRPQEVPSSLMSKDQVDRISRKSSARTHEARGGELTTYNPIARAHKDFAETIYFDTAKFDLSDKDKNTISELVKRSEKMSDFEFVVSGHTDRHGSHKDNLLLSQNRSLAVVDHLLYKSVPYGKIVIESLSEERPAVGGITRYGDRKNRRVDIYLRFISPNSK
jgi:outer membrane protein OmpA-like peptidoglycan-associated protein